MAIYKESESFFNALFDELFPILRSITGPGLRESYEIFSRYMPLDILSVNSGEKVFDWIVPLEWRCSEAYLLGPDGEMISNMERLNIEVVNYSEAVDLEIELEDLQTHLYSLPDQPDAIPYVTSYYKKRWGFCISDNQRKDLIPGTYRAVIKSEFVEGTLDIAQTVLPGKSEKEVLICSYLCHPSMANNELSGPLVLLGLYHRLKEMKNRRYTYRFVLNPETIGSLVLLREMGDYFKKNMVAGLVLNCMGGSESELAFKHSRNNGLLDKLLVHLKNCGEKIETVPFSPLKGSDERQYCSPGFQLPVCNVSRSFHISGCNKYHTSLDDKESMGIHNILKSIDSVSNIFYALDNVATFKNSAPFGEPNLGNRGLYPTLSFVQEESLKQLEELNQIKMLLNYSDGEFDTIDIAEKYNCNVEKMSSAITKLEDHELLVMQ